jgi:hypothetical protein
MTPQSGVGLVRSAVARSVVMLLLAMGLSRHAEAQPLPGIPKKLQAPTGQTLVITARAQGAQVYICSADKADATQWHWTLKGPEADLFDAKGEKIGTHFAGPTWESTDGSRVVGEVVARDDGPDPDAIPWLLLTAKARAGKGVFDTVQSIQRVFTVGGKAPASGCSAQAQGQLARAPYAATYYFYAGPQGAVTAP